MCDSGGVWVGTHTWKMTHPKVMKFFGVEKYLLLETTAQYVLRKTIEVVVQKK